MAEQVTVLHVDDDPELLSMSGELFSSGDDRVRTVTAESATEALEAFESTEIDCVVSDNVLLPDGEPFVVAVRERSDEIPIVLCTGSDWTEVSDVIEAGRVTEYVRKTGAEDVQLVAKHVLDLVDDHPSRVDAAEAVLTLGEGWEVVAVHDVDEDLELGTRIVEAVEAYVGADAMEFEPLFDSIDPEALETLLFPDGRVSEAENTQVRFTWLDLEIIVTDAGSIAVRPVDARAAPNN